MLMGTHVCYALGSPKLLGDFYGLPFLHRVLVIGRRTVTSQGPTLTTHPQAPVLTLGKLSTLLQHRKVCTSMHVFIISSGLKCGEQKEFPFLW